jgi:hypothetical protein
MILCKVAHSFFFYYSKYNKVGFSCDTCALVPRDGSLRAQTERMKNNQVKKKINDKKKYPTH